MAPTGSGNEKEYFNGILGLDHALYLFKSQFMIYDKPLKTTQPFTWRKLKVFGDYHFNANTDSYD